ncbi:chitooligosaccharide deacetylase [Domibacillus mangrovi]|uniref:Chitooligosaccharide deacetylase n=1 Tax=Domibacillus mangrovi TaxID=1714354 RepID=A0A1Q5P422_9BACI|nr:chitooligosaccharide deacetylase [Domibacillus mangrovi]
MQKIISFSLLSLLLPLIHPLDSVYSQQLDRPYYERKGDIIWDIPMKKKMVAITFDDGPHPIYTPQILDVLKKYDAYSTFFLLGAHMKKYPEIVNREIAEGHEIGNHTYSHPSFHNISESSLIDEIQTTQNLIDTFQLGKMKLFRPPGGALNKQIINTLTNDNYTIILWSWHQDTKDWTNQGVQKIANHVLSNVQNGDIILLHDSGGNRTQTVQALQIILPELQKKGYTFVTVGELLQNHPKFKR